MATDIQSEPFSVALRHLYTSVGHGHKDVTNEVTAMISAAGSRLSDLTFQEIDQLTCIFPTTHENAQSDGHATWGQVHNLIHEGLIKLTAGDAPEDLYSGLFHLEDLASLASIKINLAKGQGICPVRSGALSCYYNVDTAIKHQKAALSLLPLQTWIPENDILDPALPYDILEQGVLTSTALRYLDDDDIWQLVARVLSSTQTRKQVIEIAEKAQKSLREYAQKSLEDILAETLRLLDLKDIEAMPAETVDTKGTGTPVTMSQPFDDEVLLSTQIPSPIQKNSGIHGDDRVDKTANTILSTSLPQQSDDVNISTNADDSRQAPIGESPTYNTSHRIHAQGLKCIVEGVSTQTAAQSQGEQCHMHLHVDLAKLVDISELRHQEVMHRLDQLESSLADKEAVKQSIEDFQLKKALFKTEQADEMVAPPKVTQSAEKKDMEHQLESLGADENGSEEALKAKTRIDAEVQEWFDSFQSMEKVLMSRLEGLLVEADKGLLAALANETTLFEKPVAAKEQAYNQLCARITSLELDQRNKDTTIKALETEKATFKESLDVEKVKRQELQQQLTNAQSEKETLASAYTTLSSTLDDLKIPLATADDANAKLSISFDDFCSTIKALSTGDTINARKVDTFIDTLVVQGRALVAMELKLEAAYKTAGKNQPKGKTRRLSGTKNDLSDASNSWLPETKSLEASLPESRMQEIWGEQCKLGAFETLLCFKTEEMSDFGSEAGEVAGMKDGEDGEDVVDAEVEKDTADVNLGACELLMEDGACDDGVGSEEESWSQVSVFGSDAEGEGTKMT